MWKPVVCAVQGMCTAGAFYFVNESDVVICSQDATFFDSHVSAGLVCALEPVGLMRRIGLGETLRIALMGNDERVGADTALRIGLVTEVVPAERLWDRAHEIAGNIAARYGFATESQSCFALAAGAVGGVAAVVAAVSWGGGPGRSAGNRSVSRSMLSACCVPSRALFDIRSALPRRTVMRDV